MKLTDRQCRPDHSSAAKHLSGSDSQSLRAGSFLDLARRAMQGILLTRCMPDMESLFGPPQRASGSQGQTSLKAMNGTVSSKTIARTASKSWLDEGLSGHFCSGRGPGGHDHATITRKPRLCCLPLKENRSCLYQWSQLGGGLCSADTNALLAANLFGRSLALLEESILPHVHVIVLSPAEFRAPVIQALSMPVRSGRRQCTTRLHIHAA